MTRRPHPSAGLGEPRDLLSPDLLAPLEPAAPAASGVEGHRARVRARLLAAGPEALADHEMIESVLFLALPRRDTKPIARALLDRFGSFAAVVSAPVPDLLAVDGIGEAGAAALKTIQAAALRLARAGMRDQPLLADWQKLIDYLTASLAHEKVEHVRVLFMDTRNRLLADEAQGRGTVAHIWLYPREVMKRALELHATGLILVHNHPSGDPTPSREDIALTREMRVAADTLRLTLHDHIIIAAGRWLSFRQQGLL
jgi:DNA repair protein RadC